MIDIVNYPFFIGAKGPSIINVPSLTSPKGEMVSSSMTLHSVTVAEGRALAVIFLYTTGKLIDAHDHVGARYSDATTP